MKLREFLCEKIKQILLFHVSLQSVHERSTMCACGAADALNNYNLLYILSIFSHFDYAFEQRYVWHFLPRISYFRLPCCSTAVAQERSSALTCVSVTGVAVMVGRPAASSRSQPSPRSNCYRMRTIFSLLTCWARSVYDKQLKWPQTIMLLMTI